MAYSKRYAQLLKQARRRHLNIVGGFHPTPDDGLPDACKTVLMLGPHEPRFWPMFETAPEYWDGKTDPMDRWSKRVIDAWGNQLGATPFYPFGGPPFHPFIGWALRTQRCHISPVNLLVHDEAGLWVSFRGALALAEHVALPPPPPLPCNTCSDRPCETACPVAALIPSGYDTSACADFLKGSEGYNSCVAHGCEVRQRCPISRQFGRYPAQSAFHMRNFLENR